jgi:hypothetical protein
MDQWKIADKQQALDFFPALRAAPENSSNHLSTEGDGRTKAGSNLIKRRHRRDSGKYVTIVGVLENLCAEYPHLVKNPFNSIKNDKLSESALKNLGSADKIQGIVQCYNFFAPLIQAGLNSLRGKETNLLINRNMSRINKALIEISHKLPEDKEEK